MGSMGERRQGLATILAIGTANPPHYIMQNDFADFLFRVSNSDHLVELKQKFKTLCGNSEINKRHHLIDEDILKEHPNLCKFGATSYDTRRELVQKAVPILGKEAAVKALKEWGQPLSKITHLIFATSTFFNALPGPDFYLAKMIGLAPTTERFNILDHGCYGAGPVLRVAKALAESIPDSRVLVVYADTMAASFQAPNPDHYDLLVGHCIFGDGASAVVVGADPIPSECPLFEIVKTSQTTVPNTETVIHGYAAEKGQLYYLGKEIPFHIKGNVKKCVTDIFSSIGMEINDTNWNSLFYPVHPGGKAVLNAIEEELKLEEGKLTASRTILGEYGNMWGTSVFFVLDEMRKKSSNERKSTTGEGLDWGVLMSFGPGMTMETAVLRSIPLDHY